MWNFIVLGLIPGTNVQIGLYSWLISLIMLGIVLYAVRRERRVQTLRFLLIRLSLMHAMRPRRLRT